MPMEVKNLLFIEHLEELRSRIIKSFVCIIIASIAVYNFTCAILKYLAATVGKLVFITPVEAFVTNIKIAFFGGLFLSSPFVLYQFWQFVSAALEDKAKKGVFLFGFFSFILFIAGSLIGFFIIVPIGVKFLMSFGNDYLVPMISAGEYVSFVGFLSLAFGIVFQLPVIVLFLSKMGVVTPEFLSTNRKYAVVIIFIAAAILTPPDVFTQCLMAVPLLVLYEISIVLSKAACRRKIKAS